MSVNVLIGSARINELGQGEGGQPGDQNGQECMIEPWYLDTAHGGWYVLRPTDYQKGVKMAWDMTALCNNPNIGYSFWNNSHTLYNAAQPFGFDCSMVQTPCDTNCSRGVRVCALYAGYNVPDFYTGEEVNVFLATGEFVLLTADIYCQVPDYLEVGDILVTREAGHTAIVVSVDGEPPTPPEPTSRGICPLRGKCIRYNRCYRTRGARGL